MAPIKLIQSFYTCINTVSEFIILIIHSPYQNEFLGLVNIDRAT